MSKKMGLITIAALLAMLLTVGQPVFADSITTTPNGTWDAYPGQQDFFQTSVQPPLNADGSSNFKANGKAVIPVQLTLSQGVGAFVFESIGSDTSTANDYSYLSFTPNTTVTFNDITELSAVYAFTTGNCHGGALRWSVRVSPTQSVFIYYGDEPNTTDCTTNSQSGTNMIGLSDLRYDTSQVGGTFYDTYVHALALVGALPIVRASLVLDGGWAGDQVVTLTSATFVTAGYTDMFTPSPASALSPVCPTQPATIQINKTSGTPTGIVDGPFSIQPQDNNSIFRIVDCKYMYNLATSSLSGAGTYQVSAVINGITATNPAVFDLN
jgi:hypothetical protein